MSSGITCGGLLKTRPTTPTASLPRRCASCAPGNSARSTCLRRKTLTGHAVNSLIRARGSEADGHDCSYAASPRADRVTARQSQSRFRVSRRGHTPARLRGRGCTAGRRRALGRLQAGSLRRVASPDRFRGTGSVHPAAHRRAHAHSQPLPACCMQRWPSPSRRSPAPSRRAVTPTGNRASTPTSWRVSNAACEISPAGCPPPLARLAANGIPRDPWSPTSAHLSQVSGRRTVADARSTSAGRVLTATLTWHDRPYTSTGPWRSGWRRSADLDRESLRKPAPSSNVSGICAGQPSRLAV